MKGVILHGGYGTKLRPLTHTKPKQLIPIANKPISQYVLENLRNSGIIDIAIVLGPINPEIVKEYYGDGSQFGVKTKYIYQGQPKGIAQAVSLCKEFVGNDSFVVYLGDNLLKGGIKTLTQQFKNSNPEAMILLCKVEAPERFGVARFNQKGELVQLVEKPKEPPSNYALTGIYFFNPTIFDMIKQLKPSWRGELEITEAIQLLLDNGYNVEHKLVKEWWKDTGTPEDIIEANRLVLDEMKTKIEGTVEDKVSIQGRVSVDENTIIKRGAIIRGPAIVGHNSIVESKVYIGPYSSIGNHVRISRGEIENSIVMDHCFIDIADRITDSLIGPHSRITSGGDNKPKGKRFYVGERSYMIL